MMFKGLKIVDSIKGSNLVFYWEFKKKSDIALKWSLKRDMERNTFSFLEMIHFKCEFEFNLTFIWIIKFKNYFSDRSKIFPSILENKRPIPTSNVSF